MLKNRLHIALLAILVLPILPAVPAWAHGDKVVTQMADGSSGGLRYKTKFDITNLTYSQPNSSLTKVTLYFYKSNGDPWLVSTNKGLTSSVPVPLSPSQTMRVETDGLAANISSGYAILRNLEATTDLPDDYEVSMTVYYEVSKQNGFGVYEVIDTVSVPISQPTVSFGFPVEINPSKGLNTGFAVVNLTDNPNAVNIYLYDEDGNRYSQSASLQLSGSIPATPKQASHFLDEANFFPGLKTQGFKGMAFADSTGPVAILSILQTSTAQSGVQFATLTPAYMDSLRRNTLLFLPQGYSLDADLPVVDYFRDETSTPDAYYEIPWDLLYETDQDTTKRWLTPLSGASFSVIGVIDPSVAYQFDALTVEDLRNMTYTADRIDLGNASANLTAGFSFAVKTGLGRYAKVRVRQIFEYTDPTYKDFAIEIYVYK